MHRTNKNKEGQTIIEALIALASILLTLSAISIAVITSVNNSQFIKNQSQASKIAQDGIEQVRYLRNTNPLLVESLSGIYCMGGSDALNNGGSCNPVDNPQDIIDNTFKREIDFDQNSDVSSDCGGGTKVTVTVYWASGKCDSQNRFCHKVELVTCLSKQSGTGASL